MTTCIHMATLPVHGGDETIDYCMLSDKLCLLVSGEPCEAEEVKALVEAVREALPALVHPVPHHPGEIEDLPVRARLREALAPFSKREEEAHGA